MSERISQILLEQLSPNKIGRLLRQAVANDDYELLNFLADNSVDFNQAEGDGIGNSLICEALHNEQMFDYLLSHLDPDRVLAAIIFSEAEFDVVYNLTKKVLKKTQDFDFNEFSQMCDWLDNLVDKYSDEQVKVYINLMREYGLDIHSWPTIKEFLYLLPKHAFLIEWLLKQGVDPNMKENIILRWIIYQIPDEDEDLQGYFHAIEALFIYGANPEPEIINLIDRGATFSDLDGTFRVRVGYDEEKAQQLKEVLSTYLIDHAHLLTKPAQH